MKITAPAFNYDQSGINYSGQRKTDPRIAAFVDEALGDSKTIINVGAGAGSYEPKDKFVIAVEPSKEMRAQRILNGKSPAIASSAEYLPFDDRSFDAAMAMLTVHHWPDMEKGLKELRRVTKNQIVLMTFDPDSLGDFWNVNYFPKLIEVERQRYPKIDSIIKALGGNADIIKVPIPLDCVDGFQEAFYGRPEMFLKPEIRKSQSAWGFLPPGLEEKYAKGLEASLASGEWDKKYGHFRTQKSFTCALRLIVSK